MLLAKRIPRLLRRVPLRIVLIVPFVILTFAAVTLTGFLSFRNGQKAVNDVATQLRSETTARIEQHLQAYLETQPELKEKDPLWTGERGSLRDRGSVLYMLKKYAFQAGLDESLITCHILRHTFATRYLKSCPGDLRGLAAILGHSNLNTVLIYTAPSVEDLASRMERAEVS